MQGYCEVAARWLNKFPFFYTMIFTIDLLSRNGGQTSIYSTYQAIQFFLVMSWLFFHFLGALLAALVALCVCPKVLFKVYGIALNMMKNTWEPREITFNCGVQFTEETTAHAEMISITQLFKQTFATLELTTIATGGGYEIITVV